MEFHVAKAVLFLFQDSDDIERIIKLCGGFLQFLFFALRVISGHARLAGLAAVAAALVPAPRGAPGPDLQGKE